MIETHSMIEMHSVIEAHSMIEMHSVIEVQRVKKLRLTVIIITAALILSLASCKNGGQSPDGAIEPSVASVDTPAQAASSSDNPASGAAGLTPQEEAFVFTTKNMPVIDGSTATIPLIEAVYSVLLGIPRDEAALMVNTSGTDNAYERLIWGDADILLVYAPSPTVFNSANSNNVELEMSPIGRDGLVFLVNIANPVSSLTPEQLVLIYSGKVDNWSEVGGEDVMIKAFQRPYRSGSQTMMDELVMRGAQMAEAEPAYVISEMGGLIEVVAQFDNAQSAIGYNVYYFVSQMEMNENVRMLAVGGVTPSTQSISDGSYPFVSDFYAVIRSDTPEGSPARLLFDWIQSGDGQALVRHEGYATAG